MSEPARITGINRNTATKDQGSLAQIDPYTVGAMHTDSHVAIALCISRNGSEY
jgi:hypothetical protein